MERLARGAEGPGVSYKLQRGDLASRGREGEVEIGMRGRGTPVRKGWEGKGKKVMGLWGEEGRERGVIQRLMMCCALMKIY